MDPQKQPTRTITDKRFYKTPEDRQKILRARVRSNAAGAAGVFTSAVLYAPEAGSAAAH